MIGNYSSLIRWTEKKYIKKQVERDIEDCRKNVVKCNRSGKLSYCKPRGGMK